MPTRRPVMPRRTRRKLAMMILRGELSVAHDSLVRFSTGGQAGRLVLAFQTADTNDISALDAALIRTETRRD